MRRFLKFHALWLVLCFTYTTVAWSAPLIPSVAEVPLSGVLQKIEIPSHLGSIQKRNFLSPSSLIIHIQDAHGYFEGQKHTREILRYLQEQHQIDLIFVEGAVGELNADVLKFSRNLESQKAVVEGLVQEGLVGGAEWFLSDSKVEAYGVEDLKLYRKNLETYRALLEKKSKVQTILERLNQEITTQASRTFNKKLRTFFQEWMIYQDRQKELMRHLDILNKYAAEELQLHFSNPYEQIDWPQLTRFFKIKEMEKRLKPQKAEEEKKKLLEWARTQNIEERLLPYVISARAQLEHFYDVAAPKGFSFDQYPHYSIQLGMEILQSELDATLLFEEFQKLSDQLLEHLSENQEEKNLIRKYKDYLLLQKLLNLKLISSEYQEVLERKEALLHVISDSVKTSFLKALEFYQGARDREEAMVQNMLEQMKKSGKSKAVLVTGGFHADGLAEKFREHNLSSLEVLPRLSKVEDGKAYEEVMSLKKNIPILNSTILNARLQAGWPGFSDKEADFYALTILFTYLNKGVRPRGSDPFVDFNTSLGAKILALQVRDNLFYRGNNPVHYQDRMMGLRGTLFVARALSESRTNLSSVEQALKDTEHLYRYQVSGILDYKKEPVYKKDGALTLDQAITKAIENEDIPGQEALQRLKDGGLSTHYSNLVFYEALDSETGAKDWKGILLYGDMWAGKSGISAILHQMEGWKLGGDDFNHVFYVGEDKIIAGMDAGVPDHLMTLEVHDPDQKVYSYGYEGEDEFSLPKVKGQWVQAKAQRQFVEVTHGFLIYKGGMNRASENSSPAGVITNLRLQKARVGNEITRIPFWEILRKYEKANTNKEGEKVEHLHWAAEKIHQIVLPDKEVKYEEAPEALSESRTKTQRHLRNELSNRWKKAKEKVAYKKANQDEGLTLLEGVDLSDSNELIRLARDPFFTQKLFADKDVIGGHSNGQKREKNQAIFKEAIAREEPLTGPEIARDLNTTEPAVANAKKKLLERIRVYFELYRLKFQIQEAIASENLDALDGIPLAALHLNELFEKKMQSQHGPMNLKAFVELFRVGNITQLDFDSAKGLLQVFERRMRFLGLLEENQSIPYERGVGGISGKIPEDQKVPAWKDMGLSPESKVLSKIQALLKEGQTLTFGKLILFSAEELRAAGVSDKELKSIRHDLRREKLYLREDPVVEPEASLFGRVLGSLGLSVRARRALNKLLGMRSPIGKLLAYSPQQLLELEKFGQDSLGEVIQKLALRDLRLARSESRTFEETYPIISQFATHLGGNIVLMPRVITRLIQEAAQSSHVRPGEFKILPNVFWEMTENLKNPSVTAPDQEKGLEVRNILWGEDDAHRQKARDELYQLISNSGSFSLVAEEVLLEKPGFAHFYLSVMFWNSFLMSEERASELMGISGAYVLGQAPAFKTPVASILASMDLAPQGFLFWFPFVFPDPDVSPSAVPYMINALKRVQSELYTVSDMLRIARAEHTDPGWAKAANLAFGSAEGLQETIAFYALREFYRLYLSRAYEEFAKVQQAFLEKYGDRLGNRVAEYQTLFQKENARMRDLVDSWATQIQEGGEIANSESRAQRSQERLALQELAQPEIDAYSEAEDIEVEKTHAYALLGNPDLRVFLEFARNPPEAQVYYLIGGRGSGTGPLIQKTLRHYEKEGNLTPEERAFLEGALTDESVTESAVMKFVFEKEKVQVPFIDIEERSVAQGGSISTTTSENFNNTLKIVKKDLAERGVDNPTIAIVTSPPLLDRAQANAQIFWPKSWRLIRHKPYSIDLNSLTDDELIELMGHIVGYPEKYTNRYRLLFSDRNELKGIRDTRRRLNPSNPEFSEEEANKISAVRQAFGAYLFTLKLEYDFELNHMRLTQETTNRSESRDFNERYPILSQLMKPVGSRFLLMPWVLDQWMLAYKEQRAAEGQNINEIQVTLPAFNRALELIEQTETEEPDFWPGASRVLSVFRGSPQHQTRVMDELTRFIRESDRFEIRYEEPSLFHPQVGANGLIFIAWGDVFETLTPEHRELFNQAYQIFKRRYPKMFKAFQEAAQNSFGTVQEIDPKLFFLFLVFPNSENIFNFLRDAVNELVNLSRPLDEEEMVLFVALQILFEIYAPIAYLVLRNLQHTFLKDYEALIEAQLPGFKVAFVQGRSVMHQNVNTLAERLHRIDLPSFRGKYPILSQFMTSLGHKVVVMPRVMQGLTRKHTVEIPPQDRPSEVVDSYGFFQMLETLKDATQPGREGQEEASRVLGFLSGNNNEDKQDARKELDGLLGEIVDFNGVINSESVLLDSPEKAARLLIYSAWRRAFARHPSGFAIFLRDAYEVLQRDSKDLVAFAKSQVREHGRPFDAEMFFLSMAFPYSEESRHVFGSEVSDWKLSEAEWRDLSKDESNHRYNMAQFFNLYIPLAYEVLGDLQEAFLERFADRLGSRADAYREYFQTSNQQMRTAVTAWAETFQHPESRSESRVVRVLTELDQALRDTEVLYTYKASTLFTDRGELLFQGARTLDEAIDEAQRVGDVEGIEALQRLRDGGINTHHSNLVFYETEDPQTKQKVKKGVLLFGLPEAGKSMVSALLVKEHGWELGGDDQNQVFYVGEDKVIAGIDAGIPRNLLWLAVNDPRYEMPLHKIWAADEPGYVRPVVDEEKIKVSAQPQFVEVTHVFHLDGESESSRVEVNSGDPVGVINSQSNNHSWDGRRRLDHRLKRVPITLIKRESFNKIRQKNENLASLRWAAKQIQSTVEPATVVGRRALSESRASALKLGQSGMTINSFPVRDRIEMHLEFLERDLQRGPWNYFTAGFEDEAVNEELERAIRWMVEYVKGYAKRKKLENDEDFLKLEKAIEDLKRVVDAAGNYWVYRRNYRRPWNATELKNAGYHSLEGGGDVERLGSHYYYQLGNRLDVSKVQWNMWNHDAMREQAVANLRLERTEGPSPITVLRPPLSLVALMEEEGETPYIEIQTLQDAETFSRLIVAVKETYNINEGEPLDAFDPEALELLLKDVPKELRRPLSDFLVLRYSIRDRGFQSQPLELFSSDGKDRFQFHLSIEHAGGGEQMTLSVSTEEKGSIGGRDFILNGDSASAQIEHGYSPYDDGMDQNPAIHVDRDYRRRGIGGVLFVLSLYFSAIHGAKKFNIRNVVGPPEFFESFGFKLKERELRREDKSRKEPYLDATRELSAVALPGLPAIKPKAASSETRAVNAVAKIAGSLIAVSFYANRNQAILIIQKLNPDREPLFASDLRELKAATDIPMQIYLLFQEVDLKKGPYALLTQLSEATPQLVKALGGARSKAHFVFPAQGKRTRSESRNWNYLRRNYPREQLHQAKGSVKETLRTLEQIHPGLGRIAVSQSLKVLTQAEGDVAVELYLDQAEVDRHQLKVDLMIQAAPLIEELAAATTRKQVDDILAKAGTKRDAQGRAKIGLNVLKHLSSLRTAHEAKLLTLAAA